MNGRILVGGFKYEVNTFVAGVTTLDDLRAFGGVTDGDAIFGPEVGTGQEINAPVAIAAAEGLELIPTA